MKSKDRRDRNRGEIAGLGVGGDGALMAERMSENLIERKVKEEKRGGEMIGER